MWGAYGVERVTNEKSDELWGLTPKETAGWVPGDGAPESCPLWLGSSGTGLCQ